MTPVSSGRHLVSKNQPQREALLPAVCTPRVPDIPGDNRDTSPIQQALLDDLSRGLLTTVQNQATPVVNGLQLDRRQLGSGTAERSLYQQSVDSQQILPCGCETAAGREALGANKTAGPTSSHVPTWTARPDADPRPTSLRPRRRPARPVPGTPSPVPALIR